MEETLGHCSINGSDIWVENLLEKVCQLERERKRETEVIVYVNVSWLLTICIDSQKNCNPSRPTVPLRASTLNKSGGESESE